MKFIVVILSFLLFSCQTKNVEDEISQIEEIIGIKEGQNKNTIPQRLVKIKETINQNSAYKMKYAFASLKEDTISLEESFQANLVLAALPNRLKSKLYYTFNGVRDSSDFQDHINVFDLLIKPTSRGDQIIEGHIRDGEQNLNYPFKLFFHVK